MVPRALSASHLPCLSRHPEFAETAKAMFFKPFQRTPVRVLTTQVERPIAQLKPCCRRQRSAPALPVLGELSKNELDIKESTAEGQPRRSAVNIFLAAQPAAQPNGRPCCTSSSTGSTEQGLPTVKRRLPSPRGEAEVQQALRRLQRWWRSQLKYRSQLFENLVSELLELRFAAACEVQKAWRGYLRRRSMQNAETLSEASRSFTR